MEIELFRKLGFKCGLEIHQQLKTDEKLFCNCPAGYRNDTPDAEIIRHMRPTLSELGEYDGTALMEFKTKKRVVYQLYRDNMCTYEMDDTPPFVINKKALKIAIRLALMLNCAIVDELHVSRKQYLDGSIPTGFQRTAVVGVGGWVPYKGRKIMLSHVCLEEDACREVSDIGHTITFRTDRLSMPLLEVITQPVLEDPVEAREVNELIGRMLKASGLVRRGIGSVRQDVNVSITGGSRVELKGISKTKYVDRLTAIEALRQKNLLEIRDELKKRGLAGAKVKTVKMNVTHLLKNTSSSLISAALDSGKHIGAVKLPGYVGLLKREIQPGRTFADEFSGRVKVIACIDQMPNIAVSEIPMPDIDDKIWRILNQALDVSTSDVIVLTWGPAADVITAMNEIEIRALEAFDGIPNETRQHLGDFTTGFERILPGPDRMYPDTDSPPVAITAGEISEHERNLPRRAWEYEGEWGKHGVPEKIAQKIVVTPLAELFDSLIKRNSTNPARIFALLIKAYDKNKTLVDFDISVLMEIFDGQHRGEISSKEVENLLAYSKPESLKNNFKRLLQDKEKYSDKEIEKIIKEAISRAKGGKFRSREDRVNYLVGAVKNKSNGVISGNRLKNIIESKI
jgi:glutamyl-tRNA(Gln) amidotransferase subunit E